MKKEFLCLDVVRASTHYYLDDKHLYDFKYKDCKKPFYYKNVTLKNDAIITVGYYKQFYSLFVKCSFPKIIFGDNRNLIAEDDMGIVIDIVNNILLTMDIQTDFGLFSVSNIEITYNYICSTEVEKQVYIDAYNKQYISRRKLCNYAESSVHKNISRRTTMYDKSAEIVYRDKNAVLSSVDKRILRVEHKLSKKALNKYQTNCLIKDLIKIDLKKVMKEENKKAGLNMITVNEKKFYKILNEKIEHRNELTKYRIVVFYQELNEYGEQYVRNKYSAYIFRSYRKIMLEGGFNTIHTSSKIKKSINFQNIEQNTIIQLTKKEIKNIINKLKGEQREAKNEKSYFEKMFEKSFCLLCKVLFGISGRFIDTS